MNNKLLAIIFYFSFSGLCFAEVGLQPSMRRCLLLPIVIMGDGEKSFEVFQNIESHLKDSNWCYYRFNSSLMDILGSHRSNLSDYLKSEKVLRLVAKRSKAGSLIRVHVLSEVEGIELSLSVLGENGRDIYFSKNKKFKEKGDLVNRITKSVKGWLDQYSAIIPYDSMVRGVLGKQIVIDIGKMAYIEKGQNVRILRLQEKKIHPLLNEVVEWKVERVAEGEIANVSDYQSMVEVKHYASGLGQVKVGDWIRIERGDDLDLSTQGVKGEEKEKGKSKKIKTGRLGSVGLFFNLGEGSVTTLKNGSKKIAGFHAGLGLSATLWIMREFWTTFDFRKKFGNYKKKSGAMEHDSNSITLSTYKMIVGYKYLPMGYFYGPQINPYIGFTKYSFNMDAVPEDGFGEGSLAGLALGVWGDAPIIAKLRIMLNFELLLSPSYSEDTIIFGERESAKSFLVGIGAKWLQTRNISYIGKVELLSNRINFIDPNEYIHYRETTFSAGFTFAF